MPFALNQLQHEKKDGINILTQLVSFKRTLYKNSIYMP
jgi:hypothetical protein